jgi:hypothetical protein
MGSPSEPLTGLRQQILGDPGYSTDLTMSPAELARFRDAIRRQWLDTLREKAPGVASQFEHIDVSQYHTLAHLVDHSATWPKKNRVLPRADAQAILGFDFVARLRAELGRFSVSDVVYGTHVEHDTPEVYWRLVRPGMASDIGPIHADKWFHEIIGDDYGIPADAVTVKLWIAVFCEPGRNGLLVVPRSHTRAWRYDRIPTASGEKPVIAEDVESLGAVLVPTEPGTILAFNDRLLHGGAVNGGDATRVSAEITLVLEQ